MADPLQDGSYGPPLEGGRVRRGGPDWRLLSVLLLSGVGVFALAVAGSAAAALWWGTQQIERVDVPDLVVPGDSDGDGEVTVDEITDIVNVLVVGSDSRAGLTDEQLIALGTEAEDGQRTDTIMLLQLDPARDAVSVLSFPRDLLVTRCDGTRGRINAAYGIGERDGTGGASCLVKTVIDFTGIPVNHFIQVDFAGFIDIVDSLGGVTLYLDEPILDAYAGADFPAGCVTMSGTEALSFVRIRRLDSDFGRIARQQRFIREVVNEAASVGTLVNPPRLFGLVEAGARAVETDRRLSLAQMRRIAFSLRDIGPDQLDTRTVPATPRTINGAAYVVAEEEAAEALFAAFRDGSGVPEGLGTEEPRAVEVDDVPPVTVLNGAGIAGLAQEAREQLESAGLDVAATDNADSFDVERTEIVHPVELLEEAQLLAAAVGDAVLVPDEDADALTVVLGADWEAGELDLPLRLPASDAATATEIVEGSPDRLRPTEDTTPAPGDTEGTDIEDADTGDLPDDASPTPSPTPSFVGAEPGGSC